MSKFTTAQATKLVEGGQCKCYPLGGSYGFHKFTGYDLANYYEVATPVQVDLELNENSTADEVKTALINHFKTVERKAAKVVDEVPTDIDLKPAE